MDHRLTLITSRFSTFGMNPAPIASMACSSVPLEKTGRTRGRPARTNPSRRHRMEFLLPVDSRHRPR